MMKQESYYGTIPNFEINRNFQTKKNKPRKIIHGIRNIPYKITSFLVCISVYRISVKRHEIKISCSHNLYHTELLFMHRS